MNFGVTAKKAKALEARMAALGITEADLKERFAGAGGPGGQNVNKTSTAVLLSHLPSGVQVKMQKERSQPLNRYYARKRLCELLEEESLGGESPRMLKQKMTAKQKARRRRRSSSAHRPRKEST